MTFDPGIFAGKGTRIVRMSTNPSSNALSILNLKTAACVKTNNRLADLPKFESRDSADLALLSLATTL
jgi:hypothetical protein